MERAEMVIDTEDSRQMLEEVGRFARERIAGLTSRPESPIEPAQLAQLTQEACDLGILPVSTSENGFSIWEHSDDAQAMAFNMGALRHIAHASPGIAFSWHRMGLARSVAVQLDLALGETELQGTLLAPTGHYGLARTSLARWLKAVELQAEDKSMLSDWLDRGANTTTICAPRNWLSILWPVWSGDRIAWQHIDRVRLDAMPVTAMHGFDELDGFAVSQSLSSGKIIEMDTEKSRLTYARLLKMDMLGLLAIGGGALDRGQGLARDYTTIRKQGGKKIAEHPAVQHMLSDIEIARHHIDMALAAFARPVDDLDAGAIAATRASMSTALCHAANQAVQIHGGIGYMRDVGPEKLVRDQNMLKLMTGGVRDIPSFLAGWTGASV
jgi:acyl-CoA dehydrogenase